MQTPENASAAGPAWEQAEAHGIDMSLIEANLGKTPAERVRAHTRALNAALALRQAVGTYHARRRDPHHPPDPQPG